MNYEIKMREQNNKKAWVVAVDMGYGHQRTAYPLRDIAFSGKVVSANSSRELHARK